MVFYREKKARNPVTIKALLELRNFLLWELKAFLFSGYTSWKVMKRSAKDKHIGSCLDSKAVSRNWQ